MIFDPKRITRLAGYQDPDILALLDFERFAQYGYDLWELAAATYLIAKTYPLEADTSLFEIKKQLEKCAEFNQKEKYRLRGQAALRALDYLQKYYELNILSTRYENLREIINEETKTIKGLIPLFAKMLSY